MFQRPVPNNLKNTPTATEVSEARFKRFLKDFESYEREVTFQRTLDGFLDVYSAWKRTHRSPLKLRLVMLAFELHRLNHDVQCALSFPDEHPAAVGRPDTIDPADSTLA